MSGSADYFKQRPKLQGLAVTLLGLASVYGGFLRPWRLALAGVREFFLSPVLAAFGVAFTLLGLGLLVLGARFQAAIGVGPGQRLTKGGKIFCFVCAACAFAAYYGMIHVFRGMGYETGN